MERARRSQSALSFGAIATIEGSVRLAPQRCHRFCHGAGVPLDLAFELDRGVGQVIALERLVGSNGAKRRKGDQRGESAGAKERAHCENLLPGAWGSCGAAS